MEKCVFCQIIEKGKEAEIILETENIIVILDIDPINNGHILILPKIHESDFDKLDNSIIYEVMDVAREILKTLRKAFDIDGYSILQNGGTFCDFGHFHLHIFPRYKDDGFKWSSKKQHIANLQKVGRYIKDLLE